MKIKILLIFLSFPCYGVDEFFDSAPANVKPAIKKHYVDTENRKGRSRDVLKAIGIELRDNPTLDRVRKATSPELRVKTINWEMKHKINVFDGYKFKARRGNNLEIETNIGKVRGIRLIYAY